MFQNRSQAGKLLTEALNFLKGQDLVILALPRGGVPVAYEVAKKLNAPLDVFIARKLSAPWQPEYGFGAISETDEIIINEESCFNLKIDEVTMSEIIKSQQEEIIRRKKLYRLNKPLIDVKNKTVVLIDDGLATGVTAEVSIQSLIKLGAKQIIFAVPVAPQNSSRKFSKFCKFIALNEEEPFYAVGNFYENFSQVRDDEVLEYLDKLNNEIKNAK